MIETLLYWQTNQREVAIDLESGARLRGYIKDVGDVDGVVILETLDELSMQRGQAAIRLEHIKAVW